ncbi:hypothetical protein QTP70_031205, partial [Hemibagrus guttatus]
SLSQAVIPKCFKATIIIPVPKKPHPAYNYRPVALTPIIMKCFERLVMHYSTNHIVKFADDMTVVGLITNNNKPIHRSEKRTFTAPPLTINGAAVERVNSTKFLGVYISEDLSLMTNTTLLAKKVQSRLYFLHKLRKAQVPPPSCAPSTRTLYLCVVWRLHCLLSKDSATHRECSKQGHQCLSALPCGYLPHPPHWQCHQHRSRWFTPVKPTLQPPIFREK